MKFPQPDTILGWLAVLVVLAAIIYAIITVSRVSKKSQLALNEQEEPVSVVGAKPGRAYFPHEFTGTNGYVHSMSRNYAQQPLPVAHASHTADAGFCAFQSGVQKCSEYNNQVYCLSIDQGKSGVGCTSKNACCSNSGAGMGNCYSPSSGLLINCSQ